MSQSVVIFPGYAGQDIIDNIIQTAERSGYNPGKVFDPTNPEMVSVNSHRVCDVAEISVGVHYWLVSFIMHITKFANVDLQIDIEYPRDIFVNRYSVGGHYIFHHDIDWKKPTTQRKLSVVVQLTDPEEYEGGELEFEEVNHDEKTKQLIRQKGTVIVFPSYMRHRVTPVTKGERKSLVTWIEGPAWR